MLSTQEQLKLIEWLCGDAEENPERQTNSDKLLLNIYRIVHSHRDDHCCKAVHQDWRDESADLYEKVKQYF
jgi:hypothetical protein